MDATTAEALARYKAWGGPSGWPEKVRGERGLQHYTDLCVLADAFAAMHDETPATFGHLLNAGFKPHNDFCSLTVTQGIELHWHPDGNVLQISELDDGSIVTLPTPKTVGQLRHLLAALGLTPAESTEER